MAQHSTWPAYVSAPLPEHMRRSFDLFGFDAKRHDPIEHLPE
jgi:23S rRNA pseudouridine955/2504/2580 synthase